jgi:hypothetical protein
LFRIQELAAQLSRFLYHATMSSALLALFLVMTSSCGKDVPAVDQGGSTPTARPAIEGNPNFSLNDVPGPGNQFCPKLDPLSCNFGTESMKECDSVIADTALECYDITVAYYDCALLIQKMCELPIQCLPFEVDATTCMNTDGCKLDDCFAGGGMGGEMTCSCGGSCKGTKYSTQCTILAGSGMATCDYMVNNASVGTCLMADPGDCGPKDTCCNTDYFKLQPFLNRQTRNGTS